MNTNFWKDGLRILCVRLDNLGDVLMTTPACRALKTTWPHCHLTLLTSSAGRAIAQLIPELDQVIAADVPWMATNQAGLSIQQLTDQLRSGRFDAAIIFTVQSQNPLPAAMLCYMAGIPRVLGYCRENPYQLLTDWVPDSEVLVATRHEVDRQLTLVRTIGCQTADQRLSLQIAMTDRQYARQLLATEGLDSYRPWLVVHPGVSEAKRRYPPNGFVQVLSSLIRRHNYQIILTGSQQEHPLTVSIQKQLTGNVLNLAGKLSLPQLCGLIAETPMLLSNNTGPVHIAAAVGTPVVVLYAKTNPQHTPWQVPNRILYFDVPDALRSRNVLLQHFPEVGGSTATPATILQAIEQLAAECQSIH